MGKKAMENVTPVKRAPSAPKSNSGKKAALFLRPVILISIRAIRAGIIGALGIIH